MNLFPRELPVLIRFGLAGLIVLACLGVRSVLFGEEWHSPYLPLFVAVVLSGVAFDGWTGIFAAVLGAAIAVYFFVAPVGSFMIGSADDLYGLFAFLGIASIAALLLEALHQTTVRPQGD